MQRILALVSPLIPALPPLRGEGIALDTREDSFGYRRVLGGSELFGPHARHATGAAMRVALCKAVRRAPSPLDGKRAGMRGECGRGSPFARK
jgi:hypothetical protein